MSFKIPEEVKILFGTKQLNIIVNKPLDPKIIDFFNELSKNLLKDKTAKIFDDLMLYAFFIRASNVNKIINDKNLIGRGLAFHINTSNVPLNFAYSLFFGLLFGNTNILKISKNTFPQTIFFIDKLKYLIKKKKFNFLKKLIFIIQYDNQEQISNLISINSDIRIIWGSDQTIHKFKHFETKPRVVDLYFPDRMSLSVINSEKYLLLNKKNSLYDKFYNDSLYFDQLGCSSPNAIIWIGSESKDAADHFWKNFAKKFKSKYPFDLRKSYDKHNHIFKLTSSMSNKLKFHNYENRFLVFNVNNDSDIIKYQKGLNGIFFQTQVKDIGQISSFVSKKTQTLTYFGYNKNDLINMIYKKSIIGIDRVVKIGSALNMNLFWDGYDLKSFLTRNIENN